MFLEAVNLVEPDVLHTLRADHLDRFISALTSEAFRSASPEARQSWFKTLPKGSMPGPMPIWSVFRTNAASAFPLLAETRDRLHTWAMRWHLADDWCLEWACQTLNMWHRFPHTLRRLRWHDRVPGMTLPLTTNFNPSPVAGWNPLISRWADAEKQMLRDLKAQLKTYRREVEAVIERDGWVKIPTKRNPEHLVWLALFQVCEMEYSEIADALTNDWNELPPETRAKTNDFRRSAEGIRDAVVDVAGDIGLTRRTEGRPGRPRRGQPNNCGI